MRRSWVPEDHRATDVPGRCRSVRADHATGGLEHQRSESSRSCFSQARPCVVNAQVPSGNRAARHSSLSDCRLSGVRMSPCPRPIALSIWATGTPTSGFPFDRRDSAVRTWTRSRRLTDRWSQTVRGARAIVEGARRGGRCASLGRFLAACPGEPGPDTRFAGPVVLDPPALAEHLDQVEPEAATVVEIGSSGLDGAAAAWIAHLDPDLGWRELQTKFGDGSS